MSLTPKNWANFQHYKDRKPAWIKLHHALLDDYKFSCLPVASRALAPCLWLLASEYEGGEITAPLEEIAFRLRMSLDDLCKALGPLVESKFFILSNAVPIRAQDASDLLAAAEQPASLEKERETQVKTEKEPLSEASSDKRAKRRFEYPEDFEKFWRGYPTDPLMSKKEAYAEFNRLSAEDKARATAGNPAFVSYCGAKPDYRPVHACRYLKQRRFDGFAPSETGPPNETPEQRMKRIRDEMEAENAANEAGRGSGGKVLETGDGVRAA